MKLGKVFFLLLLLLPVCAAAQNSYYGTVVCDNPEAVTAPFGGYISNLAVRKGSRLSIGDPICTIGTNRVFAPVEGTVTGIFGQEGDQTESVKTRYGAVMYIEPLDRYTLSATTEKAYNASENKYIRIGETVYLSCVKDGSHHGTGIVTGVSSENSDSYTVEVTGGEFYMGETVGIFRSSDFAAESNIGRGTVARAVPVSVDGDGSILRLHVQQGDTVERGELLFETVTGTLDGLYAPDNKIVSGINGIVGSMELSNGSSVDKNAVLAMVYPLDCIQIRMTVPEQDLGSVQPGTKVSIEFSGDGKVCEGEIAGISYLAESSDSGTSSGYAEYQAYVNFEAPEDVRLGMTVLVDIR